MIKEYLFILSEVEIWIKKKQGRILIMDCKFKKPTGAKCGLPVLKGSKYCCLHDPDSISVYFIRNFKKYKQNDVVLGISERKGNNLIKNGVAIKLDKKLYENILDKNLVKN